MHSTYRLNAEDLSPSFLEAIKSMYPKREIEIIVQDVEDETDYLLSSPANAASLMTAIQNVQNHTNLVQMDSSEL